MLRRFMAKAQLAEATRVLDNTHYDIHTTTPTPRHTHRDATTPKHHHDIITTPSRHRRDHHGIIMTSQITMNGTLFAGKEKGGAGNSG